MAANRVERRSETRWLEMCAATALHGQLWGRTPNVAQGQSYRGRPLGDWQKEQRRRHKVGKLRPDRVAMLEAIDGWWWSNLGRAEFCVSLLRDYRQEHGDLALPRSYVDQKTGIQLGLQLANWRNLDEQGKLDPKIAEGLSWADSHWRERNKPGAAPGTPSHRRRRERLRYAPSLLERRDPGEPPLEDRRILEFEWLCLRTLQLQGDDWRYSPMVKGQLLVVHADTTLPEFVVIVCQELGDTIEYGTGLNTGALQVSYDGPQPDADEEERSPRRWAAGAQPRLRIGDLGLWEGEQFALRIGSLYRVAREPMAGYVRTKLERSIGEIAGGAYLPARAVSPRGS